MLFKSLSTWWAAPVQKRPPANAWATTLSVTLDLETLTARLIAGDRAALARAITLVESRRADHQAAARTLLERLIPHTGAAQRIGITGVPGAGKSTTIEALGCNLTAAGRKVAVLAVDPSSGRTGGSILGDKTRMERLAVDPDAYIRPSPSGGTLGGVARKTREAMLLCEAAGFDVIIVETVGVGQSETVVADMVDFFLALLIPGGGDELQGVKKGLIELADMIVINKADQDAALAERSARDYRAALHILTPASPDWTPPVITASGLRNDGLDRLWSQVERHREVMTANGGRAARRSDQNARWMWSMVRDRLDQAFRAEPGVAVLAPNLEGAVRQGRLPASVAADRMLAAFFGQA
ncbi:MAG: methylmalonyl Co-A mutase-associated GTPase MeaB [Caulobacteraceae bacterium]|nr:methylmalonyl Co-A mutase-associated GTPase MeaB [Caulobacteraceae bacterium]